MVTQFKLLTGIVIDGDDLFEEIAKLFKERASCTHCFPMFFFNSTSTACEPCPRGCINCDETRCYECLPGASLTTNNLACRRCSDPCKTCADGNSSECLSCKPPYRLYNSECVKCSRTCKTCDPSTPDVCIKCKQPFSLFPDNIGQCYMCQDYKCRICNSTNTCVLCR